MGLERSAISARGAPGAIGPYSHAIAARGLLFCSGQIALDPDSGELVGATAAEQARRALENLQAVCAAAGATLADAVKVTVYLADMAAFADVNDVYSGFFGGEDPPARATLAVAGLPQQALVEVDAIVALA